MMFSNFVLKTVTSAAFPGATIKPLEPGAFAPGQAPGENETALVEVGGLPSYLDAVSQRKPVIDRPGGGFTHTQGKDARVG